MHPGQADLATLAAFAVLAFDNQDIKNMIRHIVMWNLHQPADAPRFKALLDSCAAVVSGIVEFDVGIRRQGLEANVDVVLVSTFTDTAQLEAYQNHPHHKEVAVQLGAMRSGRHVLDFDFDTSAGAL
jgi:quinol monooxygenase YgiN